MPSSFQLRTRPEILAQMIATVRLQLDATDTNPDFNVGSILRSILEACSLQDAEQYVQIGKLLDLFARQYAKGDDLDRRALDFGAAFFAAMLRRPSLTSLSAVVVGDGTVQKFATLDGAVSALATTFPVADGSTLPIAGAAIVERGTSREETIFYTRSSNTITIVSPTTGFVNPHIDTGLFETTATSSILASSILVGASTATLQAGTDSVWPASGSVIFERSTTRREKLAFTRAGTLLTLTGTTSFAHAATSDVILSTFGSDRTVSVGSVCYVPESFASKRILFRTKAAGTLNDGDYVSSLIAVESDAAGLQTRCGSNAITDWQGEPFANATVTNPNAAVRGDDRETDDAYNARLSDFIQSLSRATALAIETLVAGQQDPFSNLTVAFAQTVEPVGPGQAQLYVTDGSATFAIDYQVFSGRDVIISDARLSEKRGRLHAYAPFLVAVAPTAAITPRIYKSVDSGVGTSSGVNYEEDTMKSWTVNAYAGMWVKTDDDLFFPIASNSAIRLTVTGGATLSLGSYAIFDFGVAPLLPGTDYNFNPSNGDLELAVALNLHDALVAASDGADPAVGAYTYSRGLAAYAQRLVNGDKSDVTDFPGIKALGTQCLVVAPTTVIPTITIQILTASGIADSDLKSTVQSVIQAYVNGLGLGAKVLIARIIELVMEVPGVTNCKIITPKSDISAIDGQLPRVNAVDIVVL